MFGTMNRSIDVSCVITVEEDANPIDTFNVVLVIKIEEGECDCK